MDALTVEATVRRIGGPDMYRNNSEGPVQRQWGPWLFSLPAGNSTFWISDSADSRYQIGLNFDGYTPYDDEFGAGILELVDMNACPIGRRPFLLYRRPYDIPTYTAVQDRWPTPHFRGLFQVALRVVGRPGRDTDAVEEPSDYAKLFRHYSLTHGDSGSPHYLVHERCSTAIPVPANVIPSEQGLAPLAADHNTRCPRT